MAVKENPPGSGRYEVEFQFRKRRIHRRCPEGTTKQEAKTFEATLRKEIFATRDLGVESDLPLDGVIQLWIDERVVGSKSERTRKGHALALADLVIGKSLRDIPDIADLYRKQARALGLAEATINNRLNVLKAVGKFAWRKRWIAENLSARIECAAPDNARHFYLTPEKLPKLIAKALTPEGRAWIALAAYTGLRRGELHALEKRQVSRGDVIDLGTSKNGEPRLVPIGKSLKEHLAYIPFERSVDSLDWEWRQARDACGLQHLHFHDLRHTTASLLANAGVDLGTIAAILGHKTLQTTKRYRHLYVDTLRAAMDKIA